MDWPKDDAPAEFEHLVEALTRAFKQGAWWRPRYEHKDKDIIWVGPPLPKNVLSPEEQLSAGGRQYSADKGRNFVELMFGLALQIGIEQGRKIEREENRTTVALLEATARHYTTTVATLARRHGIATTFGYVPCNEPAEDAESTPST